MSCRPTKLKLVIVALGLLWTCCAAAQPFSLKALTPAREAQPGQTLNLVAEVKNIGSTSATLTAHHGLSGWQMVIPPEALTLAAGESRTVPFTIRIPENAGAGVYTFSLYYADGEVKTPEVLFTVNVAQMDKLTVTLLEAPAMVMAAPYTLRFAVRNAGNAAQAVRLSVSDNLGLPLAVDPPTVSLQAGETHEVAVRVTVPGDFAKPARHSVRLLAQAADAADVSAVNLANVELIARGQAATAAYHSLPLIAGVSVGFGSGEFDSSEREAPLQFGVTGAGKLWENDPGAIYLNLTNAPEERGDNLVAYRSPDFAVALGKQDYELSSFARGSHAVGMSALGTLHLGPELALTNQAVLYSDTTGRHVGLRSALAIAEHEVGVQFLSGRDGSLVSGRYEYAPAPRTPQLQSFGVEYGLYSPADGSALSSGLRLAGILAEGPSNLSLTFDRRGAGFLGIAEASESLNFASSLRLNEALHLEEAEPLTLTGWFSHESVYAADIPNVPSRTTTSYGATLNTSLKPVALALSYAVTSQTTSAQANDASKRELGFSVRFPTGPQGLVAQSLTWRRETLLGATDPQDVLAYRVNGTVPTPGGYLSPRLTLEYTLQQSAVSEFALGASWSTEWEALSLDLAGDFNLTGNERLKLAALGRYAFSGGNALEVDVQARVFQNTEPALRFSIGYKVPFNVPVARLAGMAEVTGVFRDAGGAGVPGVAVVLGGFSAVTQADGSFHFPAVPEGNQQLTLYPGTLSPDKLTLPATPYKLELRAQEVQELEFQVVSAAAVEGRVVLVHPENLEAESGYSGFLVGQGRPEDEAALVRGLTLELRRGDIIYRTLSDSEGRFTFGHLLPGEWQLSVLRGNLPDLYRLEPETQQLHLTAEQTARRELHLLPVVRRFEIQEGGSVGN